VVADMVAIGEEVYLVGAGHQELFDVPVQGHRYLLAPVLNGTPHGVLDIPVFVGNVFEALLDSSDPSGPIRRA